VSEEFFDPEYVQPVPEVLRKDVYVSLEEFSSGAIKIVEVHIPGSGAYDVSVEVKPGWADGTELSMSARDIAAEACPKEHYTTKCIFTMRQAEHSTFTRQGDDLVHVHKIQLVDALTGGVVTLKSLQGHELRLGANELVSNDTVQVLPGQGMPKSADPSVRGDLIVQFSTIYPKQMNSAQRQLIKTALYLPAEDKLDEPQQAALRAMRCAFQFE